MLMLPVYFGSKLFSNHFQAKTPPLFENHAVENHPRAKSLFDNQNEVKSEDHETLEDILKSAQVLKQEDHPDSYIFDIGLGGEDEVEGNVFLFLLKFFMSGKDLFSLIRMFGSIAI